MIWFILPRLFASVLTLAMMVLFSRMLGAADFGRYNMVLVSGTIAHAYLFSWVDVSLTRFHRAPEFEGRLVPIALGVSGLLAAILALACLGLFVLQPRDDSSLAFALIALYGLTHMIHELGVTILLVHRLRRVYAAVVCLRPTVAVALGAALILGGYGWMAVVGAAAAGGALGGTVALSRLTGTRPRLPDARTLRTLLGYGMPLAVVQSFVMGLLLISQALLLFFVDAAAVGLFAVAQVLCFRSIRMIMSEVSKASAPEIFAALEGGGTAQADKALSRYLSLLLLLSVPLTALLILANDTVARTIFGPELAAGVAPQLPWLACAAFGIGLQGAFFSYAFAFTRDTFRQLLLVCAATGLHLAYSVLGVWWAGSLGAALAMLATACSTLGLSVLVGRQKYRVPYSSSELRKMLLGVLVFLPWGIAADHVQSLPVAWALLVAGGVLGVSTLYLSGYEGMRRLKAPGHSL